MAKKPQKLVSPSSKASVPALMKEYAAGIINRDELSRAFIEDVEWDYRGITGDEIKGGNTWFTVYTSIGNGFTGEDFMEVAQAYEDAQVAKL